MNYSTLVATIRRHATCDFPGAQREYDTEAVFMSEGVPPRHVLGPAWLKYLGEGAGAGIDMALPDLWQEGLEYVLMQEVMSINELSVKYELDLIGGFSDRCGFEHYGTGPEEKYIGELEDKAEVVMQAKWQQSYLLSCYGLHSLTVSLLGEFDGFKVYVCDIMEGEGWWGSLFFGLRVAVQPVPQP